MHTVMAEVLAEINRAKTVEQVDAVVAKATEQAEEIRKAIAARALERRNELKNA